MTTPERDVAVEFEGVSKTYRLHARPVDRMLERLGVPRPGAVEFHALKDVSLRVAKGERLGIVGRNGAGKTTLLKLITGNFAPTRGCVTTHGDVQALMQVGLGFYAGLTGYENARSALLYNGLAGAALEDALADVVDFCELGDFLHQPMSTYSLGMRMRLQFATATAIRPEILIVDEIMGAGDAYFSAKSADRMKRLTDTGCTLLLVSHSAHQVLEFCDRGLWLEEGRIRLEGSADEVVGAYEVHTEGLVGGRTGDEQTILEDGKRVHRWPSKEGVKVSRIRLSDGQREIEEAPTHSNVRCEMRLRVEREGTYACKYLVTFYDERMRRVARVASPNDTFQAARGASRDVVIDLSPLMLREGLYKASVSIYDEYTKGAADAATRFDVLARCLTLRVEGGARPPYFDHPAAWSFA